MSISQKRARAKYATHKHGAIASGIEFKLTFEEWLAIWGDKLNQRGARSWQLGMCRINDAGAYEAGNVFLGTPARNGASRRMAMENKRKINSPHCFGISGKEAQSLIEDEDTDDQYIERRLGMKTSSMWG